MHATGIPSELARKAPLGVVRPKDARGIYSQPSVQFNRLVKADLLRRIAPGFYSITPTSNVGVPGRLSMEEATAGIAAAEFGQDGFALMGISAARMQGLYPRAIAFGVVAAPRPRKPVFLTSKAHIVFVKTALQNLDLVATKLPTGMCYSTSVDQTLLDVVHHEAWAVNGQVAEEIIHMGLRRVNWERLESIAKKSRRLRALKRLKEIADDY
jgi:hypothetical protein